MSQYVMSIDAGTTGITVLLIDQTGNVAKKTYSEFPQHFPTPGWVEHDPEEIWATTERVIGEALEGVGPDAVACIGITDQRETTVVWDRATLRPVHNAIVWQDRRTAPICRELVDRGLEGEIRARTGLLVDSYFSGTKLTWLMRNVAEVSKRAATGELAFGTIDSWLIAKLTAGAAHATDYSNASRTLIYNIHDLKWDPFLLEAMEVPEQLLPEVKKSSGRFGETACEVFGDRRIPISGVAGDQQAALFGQTCFSRGMSKNTYGTGSFVLTNTGGEHGVGAKGLLTTIAWGIGDEVLYAREGAIFITGAAIQWLRDGLGVISQSSEAGSLAGSVADTQGVYFVPALTGLGAPHWDPYARGSITGITRGTTKAHVVRAAVEAMAYQTKDVIDAMVEESGVALEELRVDGGASVMDLLCQFQADLLGVPVARPAIAETTALGAAYLAGLAEGFWADRLTLSRQWKLDRRFEPADQRGKMEELYAGWSEAVARTLSR